jgi:hypothetical protein
MFDVVRKIIEIVFQIGCLNYSLGHLTERNAEMSKQEGRAIHRNSFHNVILSR